MRKYLAGTVLVALGGAAALGLAAVPAGAAPTGAKNAFVAHAVCDSGQSFDIVVNNANGQGKGTQDNNTAEWAPAHVIGSTAVFHPTAFDLTFTATGPEGTVTFINDDVRAHQTGDTTCRLSGAVSDGMGGTFSLDGSVTGTIS